MNKRTKRALRVVALGARLKDRATNGTGLGQNIALVIPGELANTARRRLAYEFSQAHVAALGVAIAFVVFRSSHDQRRISDRSAHGFPTDGSGMDLANRTGSDGLFKVSKEYADCLAQLHQFLNGRLRAVWDQAFGRMLIQQRHQKFQGSSAPVRDSRQRSFPRLVLCMEVQG